MRKAPKMTERERQKRQKARLADRRMRRLFDEALAKYGKPDELTENERVAIQKKIADAMRERALQGQMDHDPELKALCLSPSGYDPIAALDIMSRDPKVPGDQRLAAALTVIKYRKRPTPEQ